MSLTTFLTAAISFSSCITWFISLIGYRTAQWKRFDWQVGGVSSSGGLHPSGKIILETLWTGFVAFEEEQNDQVGVRSSLRENPEQLKTESTDEKMVLIWKWMKLV